ncbi:MAG: cell division protein ZapA [Clostridia bacterium]|nr:cell division protein ZapA [Clostridia bacterium]
MENNTVTVQILGRDYRLKSNNEPEQMQRAAAYVDRKMRELSAAGLTSREAVSVLAALQLADELLISQSENTRLRRKLDEMSHD